VLDVGNVIVNDDTVGRDGDGVHVVAYFGDTTGNAAYSTLDVQRLQRVMLRYDSGFDGFPNVDPIIVGDISGNGSFSAVDASRLVQETSYMFGTANTNRQEIPDLPAGVQSVRYAGPGAVLSIPASLPARVGDTVSVPINLDTAVNLESVQLTVDFDAAKLELVGVRRGSLTADFGYYIERRANGQLSVDMSRLEGLDDGSGSILVLDLKVKEGVVGTVGVNLARAVLNEGLLTPGVDASDGSIDVAPATIATPVSRLAKLLGRLRDRALETMSARLAEVDGTVPTVATRVPEHASGDVRVLESPIIRLERPSGAATHSTAIVARSTAVNSFGRGEWKRAFVSSVVADVSPNANLRVSVDAATSHASAPR